MKKLIAVVLAGTFAAVGAYADEMKQEEKKVEGKPAAEAKKDVKAADTKVQAKVEEKKATVAAKTDKAEDKKDEGKK
jgi:beta-lactam-binding protein with PASTA domain